MPQPVIAIDISPLCAPRTGVGTYVASLLNAMALHTSDLSLHAISVARARPAQIPPSIPHTHWPIPARAVYAAQRYLAWPRVEDLAGNAAVWHATNYHLPPTHRARRILTIYDLAMLRNPAWADPKITAPFLRDLPRFAREADAVLTCSEATRRDCVELLGIAEERIVVAYGAVEAGFAPPPRDVAIARVRAYGIEPPYILCVGTLEPRKNTAALVRAFALLAKSAPHRLVLIGAEGAQSNEVHAEIERLGISQRVTRLGYLKQREDLPAFYVAADVFAFPSHYEGFGLPVLEAMTCGCPVVTGNHSSLPEVAGDAALYVSTDNAEAYSAALQSILDDRELAARLRERGYERASQFSWDKSASRVLALYRALARA